MHSSCLLVFSCATEPLDSPRPVISRVGIKWRPSLYSEDGERLGRTHKYHALRLPLLPLMIVQLTSGSSTSLGPLWRPHTSITRSEAALSTLGPACATACAPMNTSDFVASYWSHKVSWKVICLQG